MRVSRRSLKPFRENRRELVREYAGDRWSDHASDKKVYVNLLSLYVQIVGRALVPKAPRFGLSTFDVRYKPQVWAMETWINNHVENNYTAERLQRIVIDALFGFGIAKVCISTPEDVAQTGYQGQAGEPGLWNVDIDDLVVDMAAREWEEVRFIGMRYEAPYEVVKESKRFKKKVRDNLTPTEDYDYNLDGDERINVMGKGDDVGDEFDPKVSLWEVYLPRHRLVVTLADDDLSGPDMEPLSVQDWVGPACGPYHILNFHPVPGNLIGKGPLSDLWNLHLSANRLYRKSIRQAENLKEVTAVAGSATEDGQRVLNAVDGEMLTVDNPERIKQLITGGQTTQSIHLMATELRDLFSRMGMNLELLGGNAPQSKTATQDQMLNQNASAGIADLQDRVVSWVSKVGKSLLWYWHHHPTRVMAIEEPFPGMPEEKLLRFVTPEQRASVPFDQIALKVDPYSLRYKTPEQRAMEMTQTMQNVITPLAPLLMQQGIGIDMNAFLRDLGKLTDQPNMRDWLTFQAPPEMQEAGATEMPHDQTLPGATSREYVRRNVGQAQSGQARDQHMKAQLAGVDVGGNGTFRGDFG